DAIAGRVVVDAAVERCPACPIGARVAELRRHVGLTVAEMRHREEQGGRNDRESTHGDPIARFAPCSESFRATFRRSASCKDWKPSATKISFLACNLPRSCTTREISWLDRARRPTWCGADGVGLGGGRSCA